MATPHAFAAAVKATATANANIGAAFSTAFAGQLQAAVEEFTLAPDDLIDVKRLPVSVTDFPSLVTHLRGIRDRLASNDDKVITSGLKKQYKLYVCCIHAFNNARPTITVFPISTMGYVRALLAHGRNNPPASLSPAGQKLWSSTFDDPSPRTVSVMVSLVHMAINA